MGNNQIPFLLNTFSTLHHPGRKFARDLQSSLFEWVLYVCKDADIDFLSRLTQLKMGLIFEYRKISYKKT